MTRILSAALLAATLLPTAAQAGQARSPASCIDLDQLVSQEPAGPDTVRFTLTARRVYTNRLASACPRLDRLGRDYRIVWDARSGTRVCSGDRFRLIDPAQAQAVGASGYPFCKLGAFERAAP